MAFTALPELVDVRVNPKSKLLAAIPPGVLNSNAGSERFGIQTPVAVTYTR
jgi:hypothetical protein